MPSPATAYPRPIVKESLAPLEAVVDLRPLIAEGEIFEFLRKTPERFREVKLEEFGHSIYWLDDEGDEIDFGSDSLRRRAIRQAEILRLAS